MNRQFRQEMREWRGQALTPEQVKVEEEKAQADKDAKVKA